MKTETYADTLRISDLHDLDEDRAADLVHAIRLALPAGIRAIEFDLSQVRSIDSDSVGMLAAVHDEVSRPGSVFTWRVLNPAPTVRQFLELVRLHRLFEITPPRSAEWATS